MKKYAGIVRDCPFCGAAAVLLESEPDDQLTKNPLINPEGTPVYFIRCTGCGIKTPYGTAGHAVFPSRYVSAEEARQHIINKWSRRKGEP